LREINLKLNPGKCEFVRFSLTFLGHVVSCDGTQFDPKEIKAIINFLVPIIVTNVQTILGLKMYYKNYVKGYSYIAIPLFDLIKKDVKWNLIY
jgi:ethanolamine transporter EutH